MRTPLPALALLALPTALAVTLHDFPPRVSGLPQSCQAIYSATISGCSQSDFGGGACSVGCVMGMASMTSKVEEACAGPYDDYPSGFSSTLLNAFLNGDGPKSVCPNAPAVLASLSSSSAGMESTTSAAAETTTQVASTTSEAPVTTSSEVQSSSVVQSTMASSTTPASSQDSTSTSVLATSTSTSYTGIPASTTYTRVPSSASLSTSSATTTTSAGGLDTDTSSSPSPKASSTSASSSSGNAQTDLDDGSGGGSPFDTEGNLRSAGSALQPAAYSIAMLAALAMIRIWL